MITDTAKLSTDQLRAEVRRLQDLSRKVNSQYAHMAKALKRRRKEERQAEHGSMGSL